LREDVPYIEKGGTGSDRESMMRNLGADEQYIAQFSFLTELSN
jgi:hypothetical protein